MAAQSQVSGFITHEYDIFAGLDVDKYSISPQPQRRFNSARNIDSAARL
jgi:hypothetical protein